MRGGSGFLLATGTMACLLGMTQAAAAAPATAQEIPIQGMVRDSVGASVAAGNIAVRIYPDSSGGVPVYDSGSAFDGAILQGVFDIVAGADAPLMLDGEQDYFLELDAAGRSVFGGGGRWRFFPGSGRHARGDLEARLDSLEAAMGLVSTPAETARARASQALSAGDSLVHGLLGIGGMTASNAAYEVTSTMLLQPVGRRGGGGIEAWLGPNYLPVFGLVVGVEQAAPVRFALHQARPNPFREQVGIVYDLPAAAPVRLAIYDVRGRCARRLLDGAVQAIGNHHVTWDARDQAGRRLSAGVYQYRIEAGDHRASGRVVLLP